MPKPSIEAKRWTVETEREALGEMGEPPQFDTDSDKPKFSIDTPPPYPSGAWHIGAVAHYSLIDMVARSQRMLGKEVLFPWGVDRNGINIELVVENEHDKTLHEWDREEFIELCKGAIDDNTADLERIAKRVGMSCDFSNTYYTDSDEYRAASQAAFIQLWNDGFITEALRPNTYCPDCGTTIADAEVYHKDDNTTLVHVKWEAETGEVIPIATTRPELIAACQTVIVHPDDERYEHLHGKKIEVPLYDRSVPIVAHPAADPEYGSGAVMICSYGDTHDVRLFRELELEPIKAIDTDWRMTDAAGPYAGMTPPEARERIITDLDEQGMIAEREQVNRKVPICERSRTPVEIINLKEWYVRQTHVLDELRELAHEMEFHPEKHRQLLLDWIDNITIDWPISRRRYYHTEIPIWYCAECGEPHVPEPGPYYRPWKEDPPFDECVECGGSDFEGEEKVFDTWMDSSISNLYIAGYPDDEDDELFPSGLRPQGRDIVRTWLYYTTLKSHLLKGERPFDNVWISGMGLDEHGRKMSKSRGNVLHPDEVIEEYGADAFRFWIASECKIGDDFRISEDRIEGAGKFLTKLFNVARFVSMFEQSDRPDELEATDEWILAEFNSVYNRSLEAYRGFDFFEPTRALRDFIWNTFAPHYMEMVKPRAYDGDISALWTLNEVLRRSMLLLAPVSPFMSHRVYADVWGGSVHEEEFPEPFDVPETELTETVLEFNSTVWNEKKERELSLKDEIEGIDVPEELESLRSDLVKMHSLV